MSGIPKEGKSGEARVEAEGSGVDENDSGLDGNEESEELLVSALSLVCLLVFRAFRGLGTYW